MTSECSNMHAADATRPTFNCSIALSTKAWTHQFKGTLGQLTINGLSALLKHAEAIKNKKFVERMKEAQKKGKLCTI